MKTITSWTAKGHKVAVVVELVTSKTIDSDGYTIPTDCCEMHITALVDDNLVGQGEPCSPPNGSPALAIIGRLGIADQSNLDKIKDAISTIKDSPEWQAKEAKNAKKIKEAKEYEAHCKIMKQAMGY